MKERVIGAFNWVKGNSIEALCMLGIVFGAVSLLCLFPEFFIGVAVGALAMAKKDLIAKWTDVL